MIDPANEVHRVAHVIETTARGLKRKRHQKHLIRGQGAIEKAMRSFFRRQEVAVVAALKPKIGPALSADPAPIKEASSGGKRFASTLLPTSLQPLTFQLDTEEASAYTEAISDMITSAGATLAKEMGSKLGAIKDQLDDVAARYMRTESLSKLTGGLNETSTDRLRTAIGDAWDQGGSYDQIVTAVRGTFDDFSETRAGLIAQTEATDAYNEGRSATAKALGFNEKSWEVESDNPCPECLGNVDDGWIDFDDTFSSGDDAPTAHPGCQCVLNFRSGAADVEESLREAGDGEWVTINGHAVLIGGGADANAERVERAKKSAVRTGQTEQAIADRSEKVLSTAIGVPRTRDNSAFDLRNDEVGIEVKTLVNGKNEKITMSKAALGRKLAEQRADGIKAYTVVVDRRTGGLEGKASYYIREGLGSFRLGSMTSTTLSEIKEMVKP